MSERTVLMPELAYFEQHKAEYLEAFPSLFVLIKDEQMMGPFPSAEAAYTTGINTFGMTAFLVKQVLEHEPVAYVPFFSLTRTSDASL